MCTNRAGAHLGVASMPTTKPRIWVTLEPEAYEILRGMAELGRTTPGRVLAEIAEPVLPALKRLVEASRQFAAWERSMRSELGGVHQDVSAGIDAAIRAIESRIPMDGGPMRGGFDPRSLEGALSSLVGSIVGDEVDCASTPRSAKSTQSPETPSPAQKTPPTNRGVIRTRGKQNQRVKKGGRNRAI